MTTDDCLKNFIRILQNNNKIILFTEYIQVKTHSFNTTLAGGRQFDYQYKPNQILLNGSKWTKMENRLPPSLEVDFFFKL